MHFSNQILLYTTTAPFCLFMPRKQTFVFVLNMSCVEPSAAKHLMDALPWWEATTALCFSHDLKCTDLYLEFSFVLFFPLWVNAGPQISGGRNPAKLWFWWPHRLKLLLLSRLWANKHMLSRSAPILSRRPFVLGSRQLGCVTAWIRLPGLKDGVFDAVINLQTRPFILPLWIMCHFLHLSSQKPTANDFKLFWGFGTEVDTKQRFFPMRVNNGDRNNRLQPSPRHFHWKLLGVRFSISVRVKYN